MVNLTKDHYSVLRDTLGTGIAGKVPTRNELSLYMMGQYPAEVVELVEAGLLHMQPGAFAHYIATDVGRDALLNKTD